MFRVGTIRARISLYASQSNILPPELNRELLKRYRSQQFFPCVPLNAHQRIR